MQIYLHCGYKFPKLYKLTSIKNGKNSFHPIQYSEFSYLEMMLKESNYNHCSFEYLKFKKSINNIDYWNQLIHTEILKNNTRNNLITHCTSNEDIQYWKNHFKSVYILKSSNDDFKINANIDFILNEEIILS